MRTCRSPGCGGDWRQLRRCCSLLGVRQSRPAQQHTSLQHLLTGVRCTLPSILEAAARTSSSETASSAAMVLVTNLSDRGTKLRTVARAAGKMVAEKVASAWGSALLLLWLHQPAAHSAKFLSSTSILSMSQWFQQAQAGAARQCGPVINTARRLGVDFSVESAVVVTGTVAACVSKARAPRC